LWLALETSDAIEDYEAQIEASVLVALNGLYETTEETCGADGSTDERRVEEIPSSRLMQAGNGSTIFPSMAPSASPTFLFGSEGSSITVILYTSGVCSGCSNDLFLSNQVGKRRQLAVEDSKRHDVSRFLQEEEDNVASFCYCPLNSTIRLAQPTIEDLELSLQIQFDEDGLSLGLQEVVEVSGDCGDTLPSEFTSLVVVTIDLQGGPILDGEEINMLGEWFLESYNSVTDVTCNSSSRQAASVSFMSDFLADSSDTSVLRSYLYEVTGLCQDCSSNARFLDPEVTSKDEVVNAYSALISVGLSRAILFDVQEVDSFFSCETEVTEFVTLVTVDLKVDVLCDEPPILDATEKAALADAFVSTYNDLISTYCDPFFRTLTSAEVVTVGDIREGDSLPIEILARGECRGCDPEDVDIYEFPGSLMAIARRNLLEELEFMNSGSRRLLEDETCYCDVQAVAQRAPLESEFIDIYEVSVGNLTLDCIGSVGECEFGTTFNTTIVLTFDQDSTVAFELFTDVIATSFQDTVNEELRTDEENCNLLFQYVQDVSARIDFVFNGDDLNETTNNEERQLHQRAGRRRVQDNSTAVGSFAPSHQPSSAPSSAPTSTFGGTDFVFVLLAVSGVCNGCSNDLLLSNQVSNNRRQLQTMVDPFRELQGGERVLRPTVFVRLVQS
jgi:hypothetical protein